MDTEKYLDDLEDYLKVGREKSKGNIKLDIKKEFPNIKNLRSTMDIGLIGRICSKTERLVKTVSVSYYNKLRKFTLEMVKLYGTDRYAKYCRELRAKYKIFPKKILIHAMYLLLIENGEIERIPELEAQLQTKRMRSLSGIISVSVIIDPYPKYMDPTTGKIEKQRFTCKHDCAFCPTQVDRSGRQIMPKSYLLREPACARGYACKFNAVEQVYNRLYTYTITNHPTTKIELIVLGGTWSEVNVHYQRQFIRDLYYAANTFPHGTYREPKSLSEEIHINETADCRIIGLTLETRPDSLCGSKGDEEIIRLRSYGCTRLQLGVQSIYDDILKRIRRGHKLEHSIEGIRKWKDAGGKVIIHLMPDLPGSTPEMDKEMWTYLVDTPHLQPDELKVYSTQTTPFTLIHKWFKEGTYVPYSEVDLDVLIDVIIDLKRKSHKIPWMRFTRVVRDIPNDYLIGGNKVTNLRQVVEHRLGKLGVRCHCVRHREVRGKEMGEYRFNIRRYAASGGKELFIECVSMDGYTLYGFLRLRFSENPAKGLEDVLGDMGMIREVHVYGSLKRIGKAGGKASQHRGIGRQLLKIAERESIKRGKRGTVVISGVGVREYYRKFGYTLEQEYMVKRFYKLPDNVILYGIIILLFLMIYGIICKSFV